MINQQRRRFGKTAVIGHVSFWMFIYISWIFLFRDSSFALLHTVTVQFCYLLFIAGNCYYNSLVTVPLLLNRKKYFLFGVCFLLGILASGALRVPVSYFVLRYIFHAPVGGFDTAKVFIDSFINILFWVVFILTAWLIRERDRSQRYIEQIEKEKAENELNFLRAQFNPHFLFNSINSIYAHIDKANKPAREMLLVFSEMLRYQLYECNVPAIDLEREINFMRNYIALQKGRIDERVEVSFCVSGNPAGRKVGPLIFITFIENAFKHLGFSETRNNRIVIRIDLSEDGLGFVVFNTKDSFPAGPGKASGLGIPNVKRRLELLYPQRHLLEIKEGEEDYSAALILSGI